MVSKEMYIRKTTFLFTDVPPLITWNTIGKNMEAIVGVVIKDDIQSGEFPGLHVENKHWLMREEWSSPTQGIN